MTFDVNNTYVLRTFYTKFRKINYLQPLSPEGGKNSRLGDNLSTLKNNL
jgi:hypothetical protein